MNGIKITAKQLNTHLQQVNEEENILIMRKQEIEQQLKQKQQVKEILQKKKQKIENSTPEVTEHCMLRYFERILGYDLNEIKKKILTPKVIDQIDVLGTKGVYATEDFYVVVKNKKAVTVYRGSYERENSN